MTNDEKNAWQSMIPAEPRAYIRGFYSWFGHSDLVIRH
jgi:hypothetical protein